MWALFLSHSHTHAQQVQMSLNWFRLYNQNETIYPNIRLLSPIYIWRKYVCKVLGMEFTSFPSFWGWIHLVFLFTWHTHTHSLSLPLLYFILSSNIMLLKFYSNALCVCLYEYYCKPTDAIAFEFIRIWKMKSTLIITWWAKED